MAPRTDRQTPRSVSTDDPVPEVVVQLLPVYARMLSQMERRGIEITSSEQLGANLRITPAQIRKDLSYFGRFGRQGRGYDVQHLAGQLRRILGLDRSWDAALVGVGRLGRAVAAYPGFRTQGVHIAAAFDINSDIVGTNVGDLTVQPLSNLRTIVRARAIKIGIVTVPADHAQDVVDTLVQAGIKSVLNYAPVDPRLPPGVRVRNIDPVLSLQSMTYYLEQ